VRPTTTCDGRLDVLLLRGAWDSPFRLSLLRNKGDGTFENVTAAAGLALPIQTQSGACGDFDNDGFVDIYVVSEQPPEIFDSRYFGRLYHNNGDGTFTDVAPALGVTDPLDSFSCWFWDYHNDGRLDLFVAGYRGFVYDVIADALGRPNAGEHPRLYKNLGKEGFRDVTAEVGLARVFLTMGSNFGDVDNDGYLDVYLATGHPNYSALIPNVMLKNVGGLRFEDVSVSSGTAHLQKGHRHPSESAPDGISAGEAYVARFQPIGIMQSRCFQGSGGTFNCVTCHDPHTRVSSDRAAYESVCLSCTVNPVAARRPLAQRPGPTIAPRRSGPRALYRHATVASNAICHESTRGKTSCTPNIGFECVAISGAVATGKSRPLARRLSAATA
jgi:FG-GAP-like repeat